VTLAMKPMIPRIRPARAMPEPPSAPALDATRLREIKPMIAAAGPSRTPRHANEQTSDKIPVTREAMPKPSDWRLAGAVPPGGGVSLTTADYKAVRGCLLRMQEPVVPFRDRRPGRLHVRQRPRSPPCGRRRSSSSPARRGSGCSALPARRHFSRAGVAGCGAARPARCRRGGCRRSPAGCCGTSFWPRREPSARCR